MNNIRQQLLNMGDLNSISISADSVELVLKEIDQMIENQELKKKLPGFVIFKCMDTTKELFRVSMIDADKPVIIRQENFNEMPADQPDLASETEPVTNLKYRTVINKQRFFNDRQEKQNKELSRPAKAKTVDKDISRSSLRKSTTIKFKNSGLKLNFNNSKGSNAKKSPSRF